MNKFEQQIMKLVIAMLDSGYTYSDLQLTFNEMIGTIWMNWAAENISEENMNETELL